jgi:hypothetical protein
MGNVSAGVLLRQIRRLVPGGQAHKVAAGDS